MQGCFLLFIKRFRTVKGYALSDTAVTLEAKAENRNQNQGKYNCKGENFHFIYKGIRCFNGRFSFISGINQTAEYDAQRSRGEVSACQCTAVDRHRTGQLVHLCFLTDKDGNRCQECQNGKVCSAHNRKHNCYKK